MRSAWLEAFGYLLPPQEASIMLVPAGTYFHCLCTSNFSLTRIVLPNKHGPATPRAPPKGSERQWGQRKKLSHQNAEHVAKFPTGGKSTKLVSCLACSKLPPRPAKAHTNGKPPAGCELPETRAAKMVPAGSVFEAYERWCCSRPRAAATRRHHRLAGGPKPRPRGPAGRPPQACRTWRT